MKREGYERNALLAAFRERSGPTPDQIETGWDRLADHDAGLGPALTPRRGPATWTVVWMAAAGLAAAFLLGWWLRGVPVTIAQRSPDADQASRTAESTPGTALAGERMPPPYRAAPSTTHTAATQDGPSTSAAPPTAAQNGGSKVPDKTAPGPTAPVPKSPRTKTAPTPATDSVVPSDSLGAEAALVSRARAALAAQRPLDALARVGEYRTTFAIRKLDEEADAIETMARCQINPEDRDTVLAGFVGAHPRSMQKAGVAHACAPPLSPQAPSSQ